MAKIRIQFPRLPAIEIEGDASECARLLLELAAATNPDSSVSQVLTQQTPRPSPATDGLVSGGRPYRGRTNRRQMVVAVMRDLYQAGFPAPDLSQIKARFLDLFPEEDTKYLDQVVRDLANKTDLVTRSGRGKFRLHVGKSETD